MYKLLLATDQSSVRTLFENGISWEKEGFSKPLVVTTAEEAIALLKSKPIDAVSFHLRKNQAEPLMNYLLDERPTLPIFECYASPDKQLAVLMDLKNLLNRLHADFADEVYDEAQMMDIVRDELTHSLLSGEITKKEVLLRWLQLIRARLDYDKPCMLFELDMPQGEVYLADRWHHGQERLENALRSNFFGRYVEDIYYAVAVLSNRHIRLVAIPRVGLLMDGASFSSKTTAHVLDSIQNIKEYLDLDIRVLDSGMLHSLTDFIVHSEDAVKQ